MSAEQHEDDPPPSRRGALVGLIAIVVLGVLAVLLVHALHHESNIEDCLMSGRSNCAPIQTH